MSHLGDQLIKACAEGNLRQVKELVEDESAPIDYKTDGWTPLVKACAGNHVDIVDFFIERGADLNIITRDGWTPLFATVTKGNHVVLEKLLEHGANARLLGKSTLCPLEKAQEKNDPRSIALINKYNSWQVEDDNSVQHFSDKGGFSISRIFNFESMTIMTIVENKARNAVSHSEQHFSEPAVDMELLMKAKEKLLERAPDAVDEGYFKQSLQRPVRKQMHRISKRPARAS